MIVEEIMKTKIITLTQDQSILVAANLMLQHKVRHLPIITEDNQLIGIVSDRDIRDATPSILTNLEEQKDILKQPIKSIMTTKLITGHPLDFVEEIGAIFYEHHISCLPIVKDKKLVGIITETDLLHTLIELTGAHQPASQIEVKAPNRAGVLNEITTVFRDHKVNILSVLIYPDKKDDSFKIVVIRAQTINPIHLIEEIKKAGYQVLWPNLPGIER
ncbi:acetoin utilization AcuB family protein [Niallia endozanthoxylica]|uniref:CBS domain-containing protein n=1 Tax=Niallia endozanthoxylica TaxID=2036016 RepID=A0A5J5HXE6_9BACI|nr:acetoin utilization AcuB family protein [Niallia endozanthoxylica]KAA9027467.1 CBS domain-containing protein [Niallia endozanthoxylica]